mgnify:CR=1 FL=1
MCYTCFQLWIPNRYIVVVWCISFCVDFSDTGSIDLTIDGGYIITVIWGPGLIGLIKLDANGSTTSSYNIPINLTQGKLLKIVDLLLRETNGKRNEPLFYIYDYGTVEKRMVIE